MRIASLVAALVLSGSAAVRPSEAIDLTATAPASLELILWCAQFPNTCQRQAADAARARCRAIGRKAQLVRSALLQRDFTYGQAGYFLYDCVR